MAACTSRAAPSMLRLRSNCRVTLVLPSELEEVISVMPAMWLNWRSSGVATEAAMICALAPGRLALTLMVGKSTCGSGETGSTVNAIGAGDGHRDGEQRGAHRPPDEWRREIHAVLRAGACCVRVVAAVREADGR